jgi:hypothetical protein
VAQHSNEHLTIAELSAYIDEELTPAELAACDAHIRTCQPCQAALADLRLTSTLLSSMPQVAVPRSFTLPTNLLTLPETPATEVRTLKRSSSLATPIWRRSMRVASTLVAILGLFFVLAGALSALPHGGAMNSASTASNGVSAPHAAAGQATTQPTPLLSSTPERNLSPNAEATRRATELTTPTPVNTSPTYGAQPQGPPTDQPALPAVLDLSQPLGRLSTGLALFLLGIVGVIVTRLLDRSSS